MNELDGAWRVVRTGGFLPPLIGVRKEITGERGATRVGRLPGIPFTVDGLSLRYRPPLSGLVDELTPEGRGYRGRAVFRGRELGTFVLHRLS